MNANAVCAISNKLLYDNVHCKKHNTMNILIELIYSFMMVASKRNMHYTKIDKVMCAYI